MTDTATIAMLGLPGTGKSTYLGALWALVQDDAVDGIKELDFSGDRLLLNELAEVVTNRKVPERTEVRNESGFFVPIGFGNGESADLAVPDLSGETSRQLVEEREWHRSLARSLEAADALMLFVHVGCIDQPVSIGLAPQDPTAAEAGPVQSRPRFSPEKACTPAKLIDLIENVAEFRQDAWPLRLALVLSAWDRVVKDVSPEPAPGDWLQARMPGVAGALFCDESRLCSAVFGVSAQGGSLPEDADVLGAKGEVRERVFARDAAGNEVVFWEPLRWALGLAHDG